MREASMKCYSVTSGVMTWTDYLFDGMGPQEDYREHVFVWAKNKRRARAAAVRFWLRRCPAKGRWRPNPCCWPHEQRYNDQPPFAGLLVLDALAATEGHSKDLRVVESGAATEGETDA